MSNSNNGNVRLEFSAQGRLDDAVRFVVDCRRGWKDCQYQLTIGGVMVEYLRLE